MGEQAKSRIDEVIEDAEAEQVDAVDVDTDEQQDAGLDVDADTGAAGEEDADEVQIIHAEDAESANEGKDKPKGPPRRVRKLLERTEKLQTELTGKDAENQLLRMQLEQLEQKAKPKPQMPTLESCEYDEQKFAQAMVDWVKQDVAPTVFDERLNEYQKQQKSEQAKAGRNKALEAHYERADQLKVKDYDEVEGKAIDVLGRDTVEDIAARTEDSHLVLYYLGKNPAKAEEIKHLLETDPVKATYSLGKLAAGLTIKAGPKKSIPDPDTPVDGGGPSGGNWQKRIEKARAEAEKTGDMTSVIKIKKEAKAAGVNL